MAERSKTYTLWHTVAFAPAPPGWRVIFLLPDRRSVMPIAGWLTQEEYHYTDPDERAYLPEGNEHTGPYRRIIPGVASDGYGWQVEPIDEGMRPDPRIWMVLAPGQPEPDDDAEAAERQRRAEEPS